MVTGRLTPKCQLMRRAYLRGESLQGNDAPRDLREAGSDVAAASTVTPATAVGKLPPSRMKLT